MGIEVPSAWVDSLAGPVVSPGIPVPTSRSHSVID